MRLAALILGLLLSVWVFIEGLIVSSLFDASHNEQDRDTASAGLIVGLAGGLAASLAIAFPLFSSILFICCGLLGYIMAGAGYGNHWVYGTLYLILGIMCYFGWRGKKTERAVALAEVNRQRERDDRMEQLLTQAQLRPQSSSPSTTCPSCGTVNLSGVKFCSECGTRIA